MNNGFDKGDFGRLKNEGTGEKDLLG